MGDFMSKGQKQKLYQQLNAQGKNSIVQKSKDLNSITVESLLDNMRDGDEYSSIVPLMVRKDFDLRAEIMKSIKEIEDIRGNKLICYLANMTNAEVQNAPISIDASDDLPFYEMLESIDKREKKLDIVLVTPGGSIEKVDHYVSIIRSRFEEVNFILPYMAMSAGTVFSMSGDEIIMDKRACIGPIDPQVVSKDGRYVPAQAIFTLLEDIKNRGEEAIKQKKNPDWTDLQILKNLDPKEIGRASSASKLSIELVHEYLTKYKFRKWNTHESSGAIVTEDEKTKRANEIAEILCSHSLWKSHSRGITREMAKDICKLKISNPEDTPLLERAIRRFWALLSWAFEKTPIYKIYISDNYSIFKSKNIVPQSK